MFPTPRPTGFASAIACVLAFGSKYAKVSAFDSFSFNKLEALWCSFCHTNGTLFQLSFLSGSAVVASSGTKRAQKLTRPRELRISEAFSGYLALATASSFSSVRPILLPEITSPRNVITPFKI